MLPLSSNNVVFGVSRPLGSGDGGESALLPQVWTRILESPRLGNGKAVVIPDVSRV